MQENAHFGHHKKGRIEKGHGVIYDEGAGVNRLSSLLIGRNRLCSLFRGMGLFMTTQFWGLLIFKETL